MSQTPVRLLPHRRLGRCGTVIEHRDMRVPVGPQGQGGPHEGTAPHAEWIVRKLREADWLLAEGHGTAEVAQQLEISEQTFHRRRNQYGGMKADDVKELRKLRDENQRLKRMVADQALDLESLREAARGNL